MRRKCVLLLVAAFLLSLGAIPLQASESMESPDYRLMYEVEAVTAFILNRNDAIFQNENSNHEMLINRCDDYFLTLQDARNYIFSRHSDDNVAFIISEAPTSFSSDSAIGRNGHDCNRNGHLWMLLETVRVYRVHVLSDGTQLWFFCHSYSVLQCQMCGAIGVS